MAGKPIGSEVGLYFDTMRDVAVGDVIRSSGSNYRVIKVRRQERGKYSGRWHLRAVKIADEDIEPDDEVHALYWYPREKRKG